MDKVVVIYGPTAVGKSAIAVELAKYMNGEIISADSMQIYKHLNVGSAKVTEQEMQGIKHHLIDIKEPYEDYSAGEFCTDAKACIKDILSRNKTPIIVGGTGLYIKSLVEEYDFAKVKKHDEFRESLNNLSNEEIYERVLNLNKNSKVDKNNRQRLIRTLEKLTFGKDTETSKPPEYDYRVFAIVDDRQKIYDRINHRAEEMLYKGLIYEAQYLRSLNLPEDNLALKAIGYKEVFPYLDDETTLDECLEVLKQKSRNYAKRQFTFLNQFKNITKIEYQGTKETARIICRIVEEE